MQISIKMSQRQGSHMLRPKKSILLVLLFLTMLGCARLPEYARPQIVEYKDRPAFLKQGVTYRTLAVDDFQALSLPQNLASHAQDIAAHACCQIRMKKDSGYQITRGYINRQIYYFGSIKHVAFEAVMIPACSWLNPDVAEEKLVYVLQHEQVHFALMELAARELTRTAKAEIQGFIAIQPTYRAAQFEIETKIKELVRSANEAVLGEHAAFDKETSLYFEPAIQQQWLERVEGRLLETTPKE